MTPKPSILSGPYGTELKNLKTYYDKSDLDDAINITSGWVYKRATGQVLLSYLNAGATIATTNTFWLAWIWWSIINNNEQRFRQAFHSHIDLTHSLTPSSKAVFACLRPFGDCYKPEEAPKTRREAKEFHRQQLVPIQENQDKVTLALFETFNTWEEALGAILAAEEIEIPVMVSFVIDKYGKLLSGESLCDVIREIDQVTWDYQPIWYGVNCCPIDAIIPASIACNNRLIIAYPNASDHDIQELDNSSHERHHGIADAQTNAKRLLWIAEAIPSIKIIGWCCGYTPRDIEAIAKYKK